MYFLLIAELNNLKHMKLKLGLWLKNNFKVQVWFFATKKVIYLIMCQLMNR